jgi:hypothetical protein
MQLTFDFMSRAASTFLKRRGIKPLHSLAVHVPTLELVFDLAALPYFEPRMANVRTISTLAARSTPSFLHQWDDPAAPNEPRGLIGVAYYITVEDLARVYATEGGGSSYNLVDVECWSIPKEDEPDEKPKKVIAKVLIVKKQTRIRSVPGQASSRYLNILRKGARGKLTLAFAILISEGILTLYSENNLPASYIAYLDSLQHYQKTSVLQWIGGILLVLLCAPIFITIFTVAKILNDDEGRSPGWLQTLSVWIGHGTWTIHDTIWKPIFGNGEQTQVA